MEGISRLIADDIFRNINYDSWQELFIPKRDFLTFIAMKKTLILSLFISLKMFGQVPKMEVIVPDFGETDGIVGILKTTNPNFPYSAVKGRNFSSTAIGWGVYGTHDGYGTGVGGFALGGAGVTGNSTSGIGGRFSSTSGYALITGTGRVGIGTPTPTAQLDVVRGTSPDGTAIFRGTTHVSHFNYATNEDTYIRGGKNGANVIINDVVGLGNVGIGTTTPQAKLHVSQGNLRVDALAGNGNVQLYADNAGTISGALPIAFSAQCTTYPNISNNTETTVPFNQENFDEGGFYNTTTFEFSAPTKGIYHFDSSVIMGNVISTASSSTFELKILVDGNTNAITVQPILISFFQSLNISQDIKLNAGQKVKISFLQNSGSSKVLTGFTGACLFSGHLITRL